MGRRRWSVRDGVARVVEVCMVDGVCMWQECGARRVPESGGGGSFRKNGATNSCLFYAKTRDTIFS